MKEVEAQYSKWVYPLPIEDLESAVSSGYWEIGEPLAAWPVYWPYRRSSQASLRILSAGCGTNQAAYIAYRYPEAQVTGIDLSVQSLEHQQRLKAKHRLSNLRLRQLNIEDAQQLGEEYDLVLCTGVLHHMPDPSKGLASLARILAPEGVAALMVYSYTLRSGVYMLQRAFREIGLEQNEQDIALVKSVLSTLDASHPVHQYIRRANDLHYDAGIVDTFLHRQDRAYAAGEIFDFTRSAGLEFLSWVDPSIYSLDLAVPDGHPLKSRLLDLSPQAEASACDALTVQVGCHRWYAAHPAYVARIKIPFDSSAFLECAVMLNSDVEIIKPADLNTLHDAICQRGQVRFTVSAITAEVLRLLVEDARSIGQAINILASSRDQSCETIVSNCRQELKRHWKNGHVYILLPESKDTLENPSLPRENGAVIAGQD